MAMKKPRRRRHSPAELAAVADAHPLAAELPAAELPADAPPPDAPPPPKSIAEVLDETGIEAAKILAEHFGPLGLHVVVIVSDAGLNQFSFRSATLGPSALFGLLHRTYRLAKRLYASF